MTSALETLKRYFGYNEFRGGQETLINDILAGRDVLGIMPTGAGKSICFQIPSLMVEGATLVVSPLISLMKDQVNALTQCGIAAAYINSSLTQPQIDRALKNAKNGAYKIIYMAPERLHTPDFILLVKSLNVSIVAVDEAHCISQWGQDFRPSYAKIPCFLAELPKRPIVAAFTATATPKVREDIVTLLGLNDPRVLITGFDRKNLYFGVKKPRNKYEALAAFLKDKRGRSGIVYCGTRKNVEAVCGHLQDSGYSASRYHAGLSDKERHDNQDDFLYDRVQIMVATNAFGMGIDKSNVSFVVHFNMPKDIESYYQEAGRAGRDGERADCILLYSGQDIRMNEWMIENDNDAQYPDKETERMLKERSRKRLREMIFYSATSDCLRKFILKYFGETPPDYCGNCDSCNTNVLLTDITTDAQMILSCVARMNGRYGSRVVLDVLLGHTNEKIERFGLNKLSTFGISKRQTRQLRAIMEFLVMQKYLTITNDDGRIVQLGERANDVLRSGAKVEMALSEKPSAETDESGAKRAAGRNGRRLVSLVNKSIGKRTNKSKDEKLFEILKEIRWQTAKEKNVPAFIIFSDNTLADMCAKLPKTGEEFLNVSGVGNVKFERYGERFLNAINQYAQKKSSIDNTVKANGVAYNKHSAEDVEITDKPVTVSTIAERINIVYPRRRPKVCAVSINEWLASEGYISAINDNGKNRKISTNKGVSIGILTEARKVGSEILRVNMFGKAAQELVVERFCRN